jgi:GNAT superfamily N-acetyltransferase
MAVRAISKMFGLSSATMLNKITYKPVVKNSSEWDIYLNLTYNYFSESWPNIIKGKSKELFKQEYAEKLDRRLKENERGLFLYAIEQEIFGLSNVYMTRNQITTLHIAEFYIIPEYRKRGFAVQMKDQIVQWGKIRGASQLKIEVDKDLRGANNFWSHFGFSLDPSGDRNIYYSDI